MLNIFAILLALFLIGRGWQRRQNTQLSGDCPDLPLSKIKEPDAISITLKQGESKTELIKQNGAWQVITNEGGKPADEEKIKQVLLTLSTAQCGNLASANPSHRTDFGLDEEHLLQIEIKNQNEEITKFWIGKVAMVPQTTYISQPDSDKTYTLKSNVRTMLTADYNDWAKKEEKTEEQQNP